MYIALQHHVVDTAHDLARRIKRHVAGQQRVAVPATAHQHFGARHGAGRQAQALQADAGPVQAEAAGIELADLPRDLHLLARRDRLDARGRHLTRRQAMAADLHPVTGFQRRQVGRIAGAYRLSQQFEPSAADVNAADRADHGMNHGDVAGRQLRAFAQGPHGNHLAHRQFARRGAAAIGQYRRAGVVLDFQAIDANAGKAGDHADDAGAANAAVGDAGAAYARATRDRSLARRTGAAHAAIADACPTHAAAADAGAANAGATRDHLVTRRASATHAAAADAGTSNARATGDHLVTRRACPTHATAADAGATQTGTTGHRLVTRRAGATHAAAADARAAYAAWFACNDVAAWRAGSADTRAQRCRRIDQRGFALAQVLRLHRRNQDERRDQGRHCLTQHPTRQEVRAGIHGLFLQISSGLDGSTLAGVAGSA